MVNNKITSYSPHLRPNEKSKVKQDHHIENNGPSEFQKVMDHLTSDPSQITFSKHAQKRVEERGIHVDGDEYLKLNQAMEKLRDKGSKGSLVVTDKNAYIVDVNSSKVITAMDRDHLEENVFTQIDSTVFL